jgi:hypothetical protein
MCSLPDPRIGGDYMVVATPARKLFPAKWTKLRQLEDERFALTSANTHSPSA